jgi:hypothetical protein
VQGEDHPDTLTYASNLAADGLPCIYFATGSKLNSCARYDLSNAVPSVS